MNTISPLSLRENDVINAGGRRTRFRVIKTSTFMNGTISVVGVANGRISHVYFKQLDEGGYADAVVVERAF